MCWLSRPKVCLKHCGVDISPCSRRGRSEVMRTTFDIFDRSSPEFGETAPPVLRSPKPRPFLCRRYCTEDMRVLGVAT